MGSELMIVAKEGETATTATDLVALKMDFADIKDTDPANNFHLDHYVHSDDLSNLGGSIAYDSATGKTTVTFPKQFLDSTFSGKNLKALSVSSVSGVGYREYDLTTIAASASADETKRTTI